MLFAGLRAARPGEGKVDEVLSLGSILFSCLERITTGATRNARWGCAEGARARACEGARCPVWSTEGA